MASAHPQPRGTNSAQSCSRGQSGRATNSHILSARCNATAWHTKCLLLSKAGNDVRDDGEDPKLVVAREILGYFLLNPEAADSLTEIARWRLMQETVRRTVESTQEALNWLTTEGYLREESRAGTGR